MSRPDLFPETFEGKLDHLAEECAEFLLAYMKYQRFGPSATDPGTGKIYNNIGQVHEEIQDVRDAIGRLYS